MKNIAFACVLFLPMAVNGAGVGLSTSSSKYFYGGGVGLSFGDVDIISLSPMVGVNLSNKTSVGVSLSYVYRNYSREQGDVSTNDYATTLLVTDR